MQIIQATAILALAASTALAADCSGYGVGSGTIRSCTIPKAKA